MAAALALSTTVGTVAVAGSMFYLNRRERQLLAAVESERASLLRANSDGMLDSQALLEAVRDHDGRVVDFIFAAVPTARCVPIWAEPSKISPAAALVKTHRISEASGLMKLYVQCVASGEPIMLGTTSRASAKLMTKSATTICASILWARTFSASHGAT